MDRGRCGYDLVANKTIRENALKHKRTCHMDRLKKIKNRQFGSSKTLDNNTPSSLLNDSITNNPRKAKIKEDRGTTIQRENRALLQRISLILTAPPKITDADYQKLKKLATRDNVREKFEKALDDKRNEEIFNRINAVPAYYHHKEWEDDYAKQKAGQKFMRQVRYKRPKGFIDPFAPPVRQEEEDDSLGDIDMDELLKDDSNPNGNKPVAGRASTTGSGKKGRAPGSKGSKSGLSSSKSTNHVNSIRGLRDDQKSSTGPQPVTGMDSNGKRTKTSPSKLERGGNRGANREQYSSKESADGRRGYSSNNGVVASDKYSNEAEKEVVDKNAPLLLAHVHRHTPLQDGRRDVDRKLPSTDILTDIQCWRKVVQSDEIKRRGSQPSKHQLDVDFDADDNDSIGSGGVYLTTQNDHKKEPRRPVAIIAVRAEILDFSERVSIVLLSVAKLLDIWKTRCGEQGNALPIHPMKSVEGSGDNSAPDAQATDPDENDPLLKAIAREIAAESSLIVENDSKVLFSEETVLRIVLPPHFAGAEVSKREPKKGSNELSADLSMSGPARVNMMNSSRLQSYDSVDDSGAGPIDVDAAVAETEKKVSLTTDCTIPFAVTAIQLAPGTPSNFTARQVGAAAAFNNQKEKMKCTLVLKELGDEKASVSVTVLEDFRSEQLAQQAKAGSGSQRMRTLEGAAINANAVFAMPLALPSIMALDTELVEEFFNNITENIQLLYDRGTNKISLCLKE